MILTRKIPYIICLIIVMELLFFSGNMVFAQIRTVGTLINEPESYKGFTLFAPNRYTRTYLINNEGRIINHWDSTYKPGQAVYLLEDGSIMRTGSVGIAGNPRFGSTGGAGGIVQNITWENTLIWEYEYSTLQHLHHHDIEVLPSGNVLIIAWEYKSDTDAIDNGRDPSLLRDGELWPDTIIEVESLGARDGTIVWEWHAWDHLIQDYDSLKSNYGVIGDHPELIDLNYAGRGQADWLHINSVKYNEKYDQIVISIHNFNEFWVIDHSTTTGEAAGHTGGRSGKGGDLLYRWGNPAAYDAGSPADQKLFGQHDAQWIKDGYPGEGNFLIFNNGLNRPAGDFSSVDEIVPPVDIDGNYLYTPGTAYDPPAQLWLYTADPPTGFYGKSISGTQRLPNGNTLVCNGPFGIFFEVTSAKENVWWYGNPVVDFGPLNQGDTVPGGPGGNLNNVFKIRRYPPEYPAFYGRRLYPGNYVELYPAVPVKIPVILIIGLTIIIISCSRPGIIIF